MPAQNAANLSRYVQFRSRHFLKIVYNIIRGDLIMREYDNMFWEYLEKLLKEDEIYNFMNNWETMKAIMIRRNS
ncbi:hypothetical protein FACS189450_05490 [Spirochaetia bacterium]|nr:hypothetical protein FACS189450_05490 [Spirochaetia bacterium]